MISSNLKIKSKTRDRLFFDKYKYSITFLIPFSATLRGCTKPNSSLDDITYLVEKHHTLFNNSAIVFNQATIEDKLKNIEIIQETYHLLNELTNFRVSHFNDWITIYTSTLECVDEATRLSNNHIRIAKANVILPRGTLTCRHSQHKYRIYLRHHPITKFEHNNMRQFINTYSDYIFQSRIFCEWLSNEWSRYCPAEYYFFFETDDLGLEYMLDLTVPGLKSRVCRIISDKYSTIEE